MNSATLFALTPSCSRILRFAACGLIAAKAGAVTYYWDTNDITAGAGSLGGSWQNNCSVFSTSSTGTTTVAKITTTSADDLIFSAGTDATGSYTITLGSSDQRANSMTFEEGSTITFLSSVAGRQISLYGGGVNAANTNVDFQSKVELFAAQNWTVNAGKLISSTGTNGSLSLTNSLTLLGAGDYRFDGVISGVGALNLSGTGTVSVNNAANTMTGLTTVNSGATLAGAGKVAALTLNSGGIMSPGTVGSSTPATLTATGFTWNGGGLMKFHLGTAGASDRLALGTGLLTKGTGTGWVFDFQNTGALGNTYTLISGTALGSGFTAADFSYIGLAAGLSGAFAYNAASGLTFTVVPEPSTYALALGVSAVLVAGVRRRRLARAR